MTPRFAVVAALLLPAVLLVACSSNLSEPTPTDTSTAGGPGQEVPGNAKTANELPDSIPLPRDAQLVEASKNFVSERARGWTAVALTAAGSGLPAISGQLTQSLQTAGWATKVTGDQQAGFVIAATRNVGAESAWVNINVTTPVPGSGPAVTYRYAVSQTKAASPSKSVAR